MIRTISSTDAETGVSMEVVIEAPDGDGHKPVVRSVKVSAANGKGSQDLLVLAMPDLTVEPPKRKIKTTRKAVPEPAPTRARKVTATAPEPAPTRARKAVAAAALATKAPARKPPKFVESVSTATPAKTARRAYRRAPDDSEIVMDYKRYQGSTRAIAQAHDVPQTTAAGWVRRLRKSGLIT